MVLPHTTLTVNMTSFTTTNSTTPQPSTEARPHNSGMSSLAAILCLVALITIPMICYTLFVAMRCPRNIFRRSPTATTAEMSCKAVKVELIGGFKYRKAAAGSNEQCPVCLSLFAEEEEIWQLSACQHAFHAACIDMWLYSHSSCPVCRAAVPVKRSRRVLIDGEDDFRQGLPDSVNLI